MSEAEIFTKYLIGEYPSPALVARYHTASMGMKGSDNRDDKIFTLAVRHPVLLPFADAALAYGGKPALLRRKLLVMLAILETTPEYYPKFSTQDESPLKWISVAWRAVSAVCKLIIGKIILLFI